jgi:alpha-galactosidase
MTLTLHEASFAPDVLLDVSIDCVRAHDGDVHHIRVSNSGDRSVRADVLSIRSNLVVEWFMEHGHQSWSTVRVANFSDARPIRADAPRWFRNQMLADGSLAGHALCADTVLIHEGGIVASAKIDGPPVTMVVGPTDGAVTIQIDLEGVELEPGASITAGELWVAEGAPGHLYSNWAAASGALAHARTDSPQPLGWCSWYQYFTEVTSEDVLANLKLAAQHGLELVQIDDGWQPSIGEWSKTSERFGLPIADLAARIRASGLTAGIWTAPFLAIEGGPVAERNEGWLVKNEAGQPRTALFHEGWGGRVYALDTSLPEVRQHLVETYAGLRSAGFDYFKIDFLHAGSVPGSRAGDGIAGRTAWLRAGLEAIREGIGDDATLLGCGSPLHVGVGTVDAMRVSEDVAPHWGPGRHFDGWEESSVGTLNAIHASVRRAPLHRRWYATDPDCALLRPRDSELNASQRRALAATIVGTGGFTVVSDDLSLYGREEWDLLDEMGRARTSVDAMVDLSDPMNPTTLEVRGPNHLLLVDLEAGQAEVSSPTIELGRISS